MLTQLTPPPNVPSPKQIVRKKSDYASGRSLIRDPRHLPSRFHPQFLVESLVSILWVKSLHPLTSRKISHWFTWKKWVLTYVILIFTYSNMVMFSMRWCEFTRGYIPLFAGWTAPRLGCVSPPQGGWTLSVHRKLLVPAIGGRGGSKKINGLWRENQRIILGHPHFLGFPEIGVPPNHPF